MLDIKDKKIIDLIEQKINTDDSYWDFKDNYHKEHIHGIFTYPATMVPRMQAEIMDIIMSVDDDINNILDPFMGSGTVLVEGMLRGLDIIGIDINPLAHLVTQVKTRPILAKNLKKKATQLFNRIENCDIQPFTFKGIHKWYIKDIADQLSLLKKSIELEPNRFFRNFFWISFCEIARISNNSRSSTFKLHIKEQQDISTFKFDCIDTFKKHIRDNIDRMEEYINFLNNNISENRRTIKYNKNIRILNGDSIKLMNDRRRFSDNSIDLISTSPPYGDNHTTVTYGQYSVLPLRWINYDDINTNIDKSIIDTQTRIDKESLGGSNYTCEYIQSSGVFELSNTLFNIYSKLVKEKETEKARKVASFYIDFNLVLKPMSRVLKSGKYAVFTVGNRRVNNEIIEFNRILEEFCVHYNLELIYDFQRNILKKRMASRISKLKTNEPVNSMREENVLIFKRLV